VAEHAGMTSLTRLFLLVVAFDVLGLIVAGGDLGTAIVSGTTTNAPFPFIAVQALAVVAATRHRAGAAVLGALCIVSIVSGFGDGSYTADLSALERTVQLALVSCTALLGAVAARDAIRPRALAVG
jgi:hypothetical protein